MSMIDKRTKCTFFLRQQSSGRNCTVFDTTVIHNANNAASSMQLASQLLPVALQDITLFRFQLDFFF